MANGNTLGTIADALTGFGAGVSGQLPQLQAQRAEQARQLSDERRRALLADNRASAKFVRAGDFGSALELLQNRAIEVERHGGDPQDTLAQLNLLQNEINDPTGSGGFLEEFLLESNILDDRAVDAGVLPPLATPDTTKQDELALKRDKFEFNQDIKNRELELNKQKLAFQKEKLIADGANQSEIKAVEQKQVNALRQSLKPFEKEFSQVEAARNRIQLSGRKGTAASDISLIFNFMKMNDPGSTVREGEFATAQNAAGVDDRVINLYNSLREGTRLAPDQREDFIGQSESLFEAQQQSFDTNIGNMLQQADEDNIPRVRVLGQKRLDEFTARQNQAALQTLPIGQESAPEPITAPLVPALGATDEQGFTLGGGGTDLSGFSTEELQQMLGTAQ